MTRAEKIAAVAHGAIREYCRETGYEIPPKWKSVANRDRRFGYITAVNFLLANPDATIRDYHEEWLKVKTAKGWKHGPMMDFDKKEHPWMVPYDQLPDECKIKDALFISVVRAFKGDEIVESLIVIPNINHQQGEHHVVRSSDDRTANEEGKGRRG